jgi:hypothetical protein
MRDFWPIGESAQADYEELRAAVLAGTPLVSAAAGRFERLGLAGLVLAPSAAVVFSATVLGAMRPPWTPHADPREDVLADGYGLVLGVARHDEAGTGRATSGDARARTGSAGS